MKFLKSQGIVIVLALIAVVLVGKNLLWPFLKPKFASRPSAKVEPPPSSPAPPSPTPASPFAQAVTAVTDKLKALASSSADTKTTEEPTNATPMNVEAIRGQASAWTSSPQRDPFKMRGRVSEKPAKEQLTLTAILRQTLSDLAVINNKIMEKGESVLGFVIESVEADRVWVSGPNGKEALEFKYFVESPKEQEKPEANPITPPAQPTRPSPATVKPTNAAIESESPGSDTLVVAEESSWESSSVEAFENLLALPVSNLAAIEEHEFYLHELINRDDTDVISATLLPE